MREVFEAAIRSVINNSGKSNSSSKKIMFKPEKVKKLQNIPDQKPKIIKEKVTQPVIKTDYYVVIFGSREIGKTALQVIHLSIYLSIYYNNLYNYSYYLSFSYLFS